MRAADVVVIPAGLAHCNMGQSADLLVVGAYPGGSDYDIRRGDPAEYEAAVRGIARTGRLVTSAALILFLSFVAMFLRIGVNGASLGQVLDPSLLLAALGAAVIGRMERLPSVTCAAIGFGIISQERLDGEPVCAVEHIEDVVSQAA